MIFGDIAHSEEMFRWLPAPFKKALQYLKTTNFDEIPAGTYELQGKEMFAILSEQTTKPVADAWPEVHRKHIDVQYLVSGRERIGVAADTGKNLVTKDWLAKDDVLFYQDIQNETTLEMRPGSFAIFFPSDVHRPGCQIDAPEPIRKVVIKVSISLLGL